LSLPYPREYLMVELITGIGYWLIFNRFLTLNSHFFRLVLELLIISLLIVVFLFDFHYQIIPDWTTLSLIILALANHYFFTSFKPASYIFSGLIAAGFFFFLYLVTRGRGMGLGDVKFVFFLGFFLGPLKTILALYWAFLTGAIVGVILILLGRYQWRRPIAFGPFLVGGLIIAWWWGEKLINWLQKWYF